MTQRSLRFFLGFILHTEGTGIVSFVIASSHPPPLFIYFYFFSLFYLGICLLCAFSLLVLVLLFSPMYLLCSPNWWLCNFVDAFFINKTCVVSLDFGGGVCLFVGFFFIGCFGGEENQVN